MPLKVLSDKLKCQKLDSPSFGDLAETPDILVCFCSHCSGFSWRSLIIRTIGPVWREPYCKKKCI